MKNRNIQALAVFILGLTALCVHAEIYSWVDEKGVKHFSDSPPSDMKAARDVRSMSTSAVDNSGETETSPDPQAAASPQPAAERRYPVVKMYSTQWCPVCRKAKAWFQTNKVPFQEIDVEASPDNERQFDALGGKGYPLILVGKNRMEGWGEDTIRGWLGMK